LPKKEARTGRAKLNPGGLEETGQVYANANLPGATVSYVEIKLCYSINLGMISAQADKRKPLVSA
jgi:hypothetical protein